VSKRIEISRHIVPAGDMDGFGHLNVGQYLQMFDAASFHIWDKMGVTYGDLVADFGVHTIAAEVKSTFFKELLVDDPIIIFASIARLGKKSLTFALEMEHEQTREVHARYEMVQVFFDPKSRTSAPMPEQLREILGRYLTY